MRKLFAMDHYIPRGINRNKNLITNDAKSSDGRTNDNDQ
tara:strand:+ start:158 stop:274 length:117 start_codon:yes stop_codon:yes gene_type:complete